MESWEKNVYDCGELKVYRLGAGPHPPCEDLYISPYYHTRKEHAKRFFGRVKNCECGKVGVPHMVPTEWVEKGKPVANYRVTLILCDECATKYGARGDKQ
jgi:hypothetical protein